MLQLWLLFLLAVNIRYVSSFSSVNKYKLFDILSKTNGVRLYKQSPEFPTVSSIKSSSLSSSSSSTALHFTASDAQMISDSLFTRGILQQQQLQEDINFCLRDSDTALSVMSRSKLLNEVTNNVMKALVIGYEPIVQQLVGQFESYREQLDRAESVFDDGEIIEGVCGNETGDVCATKLKSKDSTSVKPMFTQDQLKARQYLDQLESLLTRGFVQEAVLGGIYDRGYKHLLTMLKDNGCLFLPSTRPAPIDQDICLSLFDKTRKVPLPQPSKTQSLNAIANAVFRAVLYGRRAEKEIVISEIEKMAPLFAKKYTGGNDKSQEVLFLKTLIVLLRHGLSSAEGVNSNRIAFNGTKTITFGIDYKYPKNGALDHIDDIEDIMSLRLFDTYQNAFQRVVECCFVETGRRPGGAQNNEVVMSLASWEKTLRVDLTEPLWKRNPAELAGVWSLADVRGDGSLTKVTLDQPLKWLGDRSKEVCLSAYLTGSNHIISLALHYSNLHLVFFFVIITLIL